MRGGTANYPQRKELFEKQKETVEAEIEHMNKVPDMIKFKCWYYNQAIQDESENRVQQMIDNGLPDDIQKLYDHAHS